MVFLYRKNGGEVLGVSTDPSAYADADATYYGALTDPAAPNGADLSVPKIYDGSQVRNASAPEQATFVTAAATDANLQQRTAALALAITNPVQRKILIGIVSVLIDELNTLRQWDASFKTATNGAGTFAAFKTAVAGLPATPDRTLAQAKTAIQNVINNGLVD